MKYIVISLSVNPSANPEEFEGLELAELLSDVEAELTLCNTSREVHDALRSIEDAGQRDWRVFEVDHGKAYRRAVSFKMDGPRSYDVEVGTPDNHDD